MTLVRYEVSQLVSGLFLYSSQKSKHGIKENGMLLEVTVYFDVALSSTFEGFTPKDTWVKMLGKLSFLHKLFLEMKHRSTTTITE